MKTEIDVMQWPHPPHNVGHWWWRLFYRMKGWLVCSWRGHARVDAEFVSYCDRCRCGLPSTAAFPAEWSPPETGTKS